MVITNPLPEEDHDAVEHAIETTIGESVSIDEVSTASGSFDYVVTVTQAQTRRMRTVRCKVKWHEQANDWEVRVEKKGTWLS